MLRPLSGIVDRQLDDANKLVLATAEETAEGIEGDVCMHVESELKMEEYLVVERTRGGL